MFENRLLRAALRDSARDCAHINLVMPAKAAEVVRDANGVRVALDDSRLLSSSLLIGAEGRNSPTREAAHKVDREAHRHPWYFVGAAALFAAIFGFFLGRKTDQPISGRDIIDYYQGGM